MRAPPSLSFTLSVPYVLYNRVFTLEKGVLSSEMTILACSMEVERCRACFWPQGKQLTVPHCCEELGKVSIVYMMVCEKILQKKKDQEGVGRSHRECKQRHGVCSRWVLVCPGARVAIHRLETPKKTPSQAIDRVGGVVVLLQFGILLLAFIGIPKEAFGTKEIGRLWQSIRSSLAPDVAIGTAAIASASPIPRWSVGVGCRVGCRRSRRGENGRKCVSAAFFSKPK